MTNKKEFLSDVAWSLWQTIARHGMDFLINGLLLGPLSKRIAVDVSPPNTGARRLLTARALSRNGIDGCSLGGPAPQGWAKFAIRKGLPGPNQKRMAVENKPHTVDDFSGKIEEGYGKGIKKLVWSGNAIIKIEDQTRIGKVNIHEHRADRAGLHYDFVAEGVAPNTKQFEISIPNGDYKGRYAFLRPAGFEPGQVLVTRMKDYGLALAKPIFHLKDVDFLKELDAQPNDTIVEWKPDGCFTGEAQILCYDGSPIKMKDIIKGANPVLAGMNVQGNIIPSYITKRMKNSKKKNWLKVSTSCPSVPRSSKVAMKRVMIITDNHHVLYKDKYVPISSLSIGSTISTVEYQPPHYLLDSIEAGLLGDGSICKNGSSWNYKEGHAFKHLNYVAEMRGWFGNCGVMVSNTTSGFGTKMCWVQSRTYNILENFRSKWYPQGIKKVPEDLSWITNRTIAKWFMDDGSRSHSMNQKDRAVFSTHGFEKPDVQRLADKLSELYKVSCTVEFSKGWFIRVNSSPFVHPQPGVKSIGGAIDNFWKAIAPYIVPVMRYKLPEQYRNEPFIGLPPAHEQMIRVDATILSISTINRNLPRNAFDIETTTHNYICHGVIVHNSLANVVIQGNQATFRSHRETGETYYDKLPSLEWLANHSRLLTNRILFPGPDQDGTVLKGELFHPEGAARVGGILNSAPDKAQVYQQEHGPVTFYAWDLVKLKGKDVSHEPYSIRRAQLERVVADIRKSNSNWDVVPAVHSKFERFYNRIVTDRRGLPFSEGVVVKRGSEQASDPWHKIKPRDTVDVRVLELLEGAGKREGKVGRMLVETDGGGRGEVGSFQATDAQLQWMWNNRDLLRGQIAEIHVQEITKSGAPRAGVFYRWHPSKSEAALLMYSLDDRNSMYAMKSAVGWRHK